MKKKKEGKQKKKKRVIFLCVCRKCYTYLNTNYYCVVKPPKPPDLTLPLRISPTVPKENVNRTGLLME